LKLRYDNEKIINEQLKEKDIELIKQEKKTKAILNKHKDELNKLDKEIESLQKDKKEYLNKKLIIERDLNDKENLNNYLKDLFEKEKYKLEKQYD
jgi:uncharacterized protein YoxC